MRERDRERERETQREREREREHERETEIIQLFKQPLPWSCFVQTQVSKNHKSNLFQFISAC